ncbi:MAG: protein-disulfide reductase DsbD N-terminal domain-containing protein [Acidobacteriota bacterium]|nr:protein-disulfide reductase DsbD N-terminal domain-containing protein [Acidobacteriota bacterium]
MNIRLLNTILVTVFGLFVGIFFDVNAQSISGSIGNGAVSRGTTAMGAVILSIPGGLHVNSNRPNSEYAIPTTVRVIGSGVRAGRVAYPRGKNRRFQFSENSINVYEGRVAIPFTVTVPKNFRGNTVRVRATVRYQACTEEVCYPPKNKQVIMTARVR